MRSQGKPKSTPSAHQWMPSDEPLAGHSPLSRLKAVRRMLLPTAVRRMVSMLNDDDKHLPAWNRRLEALNRLEKWAQSSSSITELQQRVLDSTQLGNLLELERAFRTMIQGIEAGDLEARNLETAPLDVAHQVISWWNRDMSTVLDRAREQIEKRFQNPAAPT